MLAAAALSGLGEALATVTQEREDIAKDLTKTEDDYMIGALQGRDATLQAAAQTFETLHAVLSKAGV